MPNETKEKIFFTGINESISLLLLPTFSYFLLYVHEIGYCKCFGIPPYLIKPDLSTFLWFSLPVFGISYFLVQLIDSLFSLKEMPTNVGPIRRILILYFPFVLLFLILEVIYRWQWKRFEFQAIILALTLFVVMMADVLAIVISVISKGKGQSLLSELKGLEQVLKFTYLRSRVGRQMLLLLFLFMIGFLISFSLGESEALNQEVFLVPTSHPNSIVVRNYGDKIICIDLGKEEKNLPNYFFVLQLGADPDVLFVAQKIGPLNFQNKSGFSPCISKLRPYLPFP
jgi:hypothetical protein